MSKQEGTEAIQSFLGLQTPASFHRHDEAAAYLRKLVQGRETRFSLEGSRWRRIDAYTAARVAHQAYLTFSERQLREQMEKDLTLLVRGESVHGVVWHFFRKVNQKGRVGPSSAFRTELEANGIMVVIHD